MISRQFSPLSSGEFRE